MRPQIRELRQGREHGIEARDHLLEARRVNERAGLHHGVSELVGHGNVVSRLRRRSDLRVQDIKVRRAVLDSEGHGGQSEAHESEHADEGLLWHLYALVQVDLGPHDAQPMRLRMSVARGFRTSASVQ